MASQYHHSRQVIAGMTNVMPFILVLRFNLGKFSSHDQWQYGVVLGGLSSRLVRAGTSVECFGTQARDLTLLLSGMKLTLKSTFKWC